MARHIWFLASLGGCFEFFQFIGGFGPRTRGLALDAIAR